MGAVVVAAFALTLVTPVPATAFELDPNVPWADTALLPPEVSCKSIFSADSTVDDLMRAIPPLNQFSSSPGKMSDWILSLAQNPDVLATLKEYLYWDRSSLRYATEAQLSWPAVVGATKYVVQAPYGPPRFTYDATYYDPLGHTVSPDEQMPLDIKAGEGHAHLTYLIYAINEERGLRSAPTKVEIRVNRSTIAEGDTEKPGTACGFFDTDEPTSAVHNAAPWNVQAAQPKLPVIPTFGSATCTERHGDWEKDRVAVVSYPLITRPNSTLVNLATGTKWDLGTVITSSNKTELSLYHVDNTLPQLPVEPGDVLVLEVREGDRDGSLAHRLQVHVEYENGLATSIRCYSPDTALPKPTAPIFGPSSCESFGSTGIKLTWPRLSTDTQFWGQLVHQPTGAKVGLGVATGGNSATVGLAHLDNRYGTLPVTPAPGDTFVIEIRHGKSTSPIRYTVPVYGVFEDGKPIAMRCNP